MTGVFWVLAPLMTLAALGMVLARKAVHSALCLAVVMISLAVLYASLDAPFLFVVQIIVYTGAILMLFLFVLMLVGVDSSDSLVETLKGQRWWAIAAAVLFAVLAFVTLGQVTFGKMAGFNTITDGNSVPMTPSDNVPEIASLLFSKYVFAFEVTSALLITAAVGAMVLAHRERLTRKATQVELASDRFKEYAETGKHPGQLPPPGTFARHNAVDTPALLPDGSIAEKSVSRVLVARGVERDPKRYTDAVPAIAREITADQPAPPGESAAPAEASPAETESAVVAEGVRTVESVEEGKA